MEAEHQVQLGLVRALEEALEAARSPASGAAPSPGGPGVASILRQLVDYSDAHFLSEQLLMRQHAYPAYEDHVQEHDRLVGELRAIAEAWDRGEAGSARDLLGRVHAWLRVHMHTADSALEAYMAERGLS